MTVEDNLALPLRERGKLSEPQIAERVAEALENGLGGLKGHRSVGGCRASIYNATSLEAVESLVDFMKAFAKKHG